MRSLNNIEEQNLKVLTENSVSLTLIEPTENGLKKSILDATGSVRNYLKKNSFHDYGLQSQGPENKIVIEAVIYNENNTFNSKTSLYRPQTKKGDPRIWFSGLTKHSKPNDILALICFDRKIHILNLTQLSVDQLLKSALINPLKELIQEIKGVENAIANELLIMLRKIAGSPIPSLLNADTSVGRTLETALGIDINSSKKPDYKGIELKSSRAKKGTRKTLFAQVADWKLSKLKSSAEILDSFGYPADTEYKRLNCTVSAIVRNSQGLMFNLNSESNCLLENSDKQEIGDFAVWTLDKLHKRLLEKHNETFWVKAESIQHNGREHFLYKEVEHTRKPIVSQFDILLEQGIITMDHLISRKPNKGVTERGPLFKIKPNSLNLLFPPSNIYSLI